MHGQQNIKMTKLFAKLRKATKN